jgi:hypothetical protein
VAVAVIGERSRISGEVDRVPGEDAVQVIAPDRGDRTLDERMRDR